MSRVDEERTGLEEGQLEESAEELYEHAPCGYISTRPDGLIIKVNQTFLSWTGYQREELLGRKRFYELLTMAGRIFHETHYAPLLRMQGFVRELRLELVCANQLTLPILINSVQKKDAAGTPLLNRTTIFNATERKLYERELLLARRKAEQEAQNKAALLATISHEIRNPLSALTAATRLLGMTPLSEKQEKYLRILAASSGSLLALVNDILDWSKIEAGKLSLEQRPFDPRELLIGIVNGLAARAEEKKLLLRADLDERLPARLLGDPVKLGQILTNLTSNAIKFTERGSVTLTLAVRAQHEGECSVDFRVSDTGIGIAPDQLATIFEEYTQASYDIGMKYGGTGLGLSISRKLLELHGSKMSVESVVGKGSTFSFELRLKTGEDVSTEVPRSAVPEQALRGLRVLLAEDSDVNTYVLTHWLERWGIAFDTVQNGRLAVEQVLKGGYDLVLMDLHMPGLNGYEATRTIRQQPDERLRQLPIIAISASAQLWQHGSVRQAGFTDFISKPFDTDVLFRMMALHTSRELPEPPESPEQEPARPRPEPLASATAPAPDFSLARLEQRADGDPQVRAALARLTLHELEQTRPALRSALAAGAPDKLEHLCQELEGTIRLLDADALAAALRRAKSLLASDKRPPARVQAVTFAVDWEMEALIEALAGIANQDF
ncbi:PAS domain S-box-containing protein [Archangium gephyra]|uniref:histidine kinase n=1 Tax=Archangium gephyra TaxID=48 RepID=A0AAC8TIK2_9BACT|nr:ATP-binding protein [Archangium gephyra]AKJ05671.1 multi-sensor hybrid histidine kinase [Archangium gephyra]REG36351.1 PAS domain S-box-containing protein [Archangium gephyra]